MTVIDFSGDAFKIQISRKLKLKTIEDIIKALVFEMANVFVCFMMRNIDSEDYESDHCFLQSILSWVSDSFYWSYRLRLKIVIEAINLKDELNVSTDQKWHRLKPREAVNRKRRIDTSCASSVNSSTKSLFVAGVRKLFMNHDRKLFGGLLALNGVQVIWSDELVTSGVTFVQ